MPPITAPLPPGPVGPLAIRPPLTRPPGLPPGAGSNNILPFRRPPAPGFPLPPGGLPEPLKPSQPLYPGELDNPFDPSKPHENPYYPLFGPPVFQPGEDLFHPAPEDNFHSPPTVIGPAPPDPNRNILGRYKVAFLSVVRSTPGSPGNITSVRFEPPQILDALIFNNRPGDVRPTFNTAGFAGLTDAYGNTSFGQFSDLITYNSVPVFLRDPVYTNSGTPSPTAPPPEP